MKYFSQSYNEVSIHNLKAAHAECSSDYEILTMSYFSLTNCQIPPGSISIKLKVINYSIVCHIVAGKGFKQFVSKAKSLICRL